MSFPYLVSVDAGANSIPVEKRDAKNAPLP